MRRSENRNTVKTWRSLIRSNETRGAFDFDEEPTWTHYLFSIESIEISRHW